MNTKITLPDLVEQMALASNTSKRVCELFAKELFATIAQALIDGESVKVKGIGTFKPNAGDESGDRLIFIPDKALAEAVNQPFAQFEAVELDEAVTDEMLAEIDREFPSQILADDVEALHQQEQASSSNAITQPEPAKDEPDVAPVTPTEPPASEQKATVVEPLTPPPFRHDEPVVEPKSADNQPDEAEDSTTPPVATSVTQADDEPQAEGATEDAPAIMAQSATGGRRFAPWLLGLLAVVVLGGLAWMCSRDSGKQDNNGQPTVAVADSDSSQLAESTAAAPAESAPVVTDTVTRTIVLSTLAERHYGSPWFWVYIYDANRDRISDPNNITPGTAVVIPPASEYGIDANDPQSLKRAQLRSWKILNGKE